ncbi:hypothetical protein M758_10G147400 [Ceratodon purpureus]|nr:hypothetical protein M758_10G147400 [Ceratodon purpureus]
MHRLRVGATQCCHCPVLAFGSKHLRMTSIATYTRKRRVGAVAGSSEGVSVAVKSDFEEFRHVGVVKEEESRPRRGRKVKKEEVEEAVPEDSNVGEVESHVREDVVGRGFKAEVGGDGVAGEGGCEALLKAMDDMVVALAPLSFKAPVAFVYNPLEYARKPHEEYVRKYGGKKVDVLLVGMNPGPFGMAQTGVPFGDSVHVREFLHITSEVEPPKEMHPKRPIIGLRCPRREVSGQRVWGWAQARFGTASAFFDRFWIHNYCPLMFMEPSGKNRTPDKLTISERASITNICNAALRIVIDVTKPRLIVGIGKYAAERIKQCASPGAQVGDIMHPSPANPKANKDWDKLIEAQLRGLGVDI